MATGIFIDHGWRPVRLSCPPGRGSVRLLLHSHKLGDPFCRSVLARVLVQIIRTDCGSKRCFGNARSIYTVDFRATKFSATQPTQPYRFTFLCWNTSIRVFARLVHRIFARPMYQKESKLLLARLSADTLGEIGGLTLVATPHLAVPRTAYPARCRGTAEFRQKTSKRPAHERVPTSRNAG